MANTGYKGFMTLQQYYTDDNSATGATKINGIGDPDYIAPVYDPVSCSVANTTINVGTYVMSFVSFAYDMMNTITSNYDELSFDYDESWITVVPSGYSGDVSLDVFVTENLTGYIRYSNIFIYHNGSALMAISVEQYP